MFKPPSLNFFFKSRLSRTVAQFLKIMLLILPILYLVNKFYFQLYTRFIAVYKNLYEIWDHFLKTIEYIIFGNLLWICYFGNLKNFIFTLRNFFNVKEGCLTWFIAEFDENWESHVDFLFSYICPHVNHMTYSKWWVLGASVNLKE